MGLRRGLVMGVIVVSIAVSGVEAQLVDEDFDSHATGSPPASPWWTWGTSGTVLVDDTVFSGSSGKSVQLNRVAFDYQPFAFGRDFQPIIGETELTYHFRLASGSDREALCVFGHDSADQMVGWWISHGGQFGNAVATYSESQGWTWVMDISGDTWYGVHLLIHPSTHSYDITVWQDDNPANTATVPGIDFRNGALADTIDQIQAGDFYGSYSDIRPAWVDGIFLIGPSVFADAFETGDTGQWSTGQP